MFLSASVRNRDAEGIIPKILALAREIKAEAHGPCKNVKEKAEDLEALVLSLRERLVGNNVGDSSTSSSDLERILGDEEPDGVCTSVISLKNALSCPILRRQYDEVARKPRPGMVFVPPSDPANLDKVLREIERVSAASWLRFNGFVKGSPHLLEQYTSFEFHCPIAFEKAFWYYQGGKSSKIKGFPDFVPNYPSGASAEVRKQVDVGCAAAKAIFIKNGKWRNATQEPFSFESRAHLLLLMMGGKARNSEIYTQCKVLKKYYADTISDPSLALPTIPEASSGSGGVGRSSQNVNDCEHADGTIADGDGRLAVDGDEQPFASIDEALFDHTALSSVLDGEPSPDDAGSISDDDPNSGTRGDDSDDDNLPLNGLIVTDGSKDDDVSTIATRESFIPTDVERRRAIILMVVDDEVAELAPSDRVTAKQVILEAADSLPSDLTSQAIHIGQALVKALPKLCPVLLFSKASRLVATN